MTEPIDTPAQRTPAELYGATCAAIEQEHAQALATADADYQRVQAYAGLVRQELVNAAVARRTASLELAEQHYLEAVASRPVNAASNEQETAT